MYFEAIRSVFTWKSIVDIAIVAFFIYQILSMLKGTRAAQVLIGILVIFVAYVVSNVLEFETVKWIISKFYSSFIIVVIVIFQDDIRRLLSRFGKGPFASGVDISSGANVIDEIISAAKTLSHERTGAIIVFERSIGLDKLYDHAVKLDAIVTEQLINSLFHSFSPLHDGAVIVQKNRITCASAQLPLSKNPKFSKKTGTRHSAAVGISEETDAVVLVVSEETGNISIAWQGNLQKQQSAEHARRLLYALLIPVGFRSPIARLFENKIVFTTKKILNAFYAIIFFKKNKEEKINLDGLKNEDSVGQLNLWLSAGRHAKINSQFIGITNTETQTAQVDFERSQEEPFEKNEAIKALSELQPNERFDPPLPTSRPPGDVSIGGISLDKSDEDQEKKDKPKGK